MPERHTGVTNRHGQRSGFPGQTLTYQHLGGQYGLLLHGACHAAPGAGVPTPLGVRRLR